MDSFLIDYLKSGKAWVLVGSGPSIEMGYPSWPDLASCARETTRIETPGFNLGALDAAMKRRDFPRVFEEAKAALGSERLLQALQTKLVPSRPAEIYQMIVRWPIPVYLTTNYDDEIQKHLSELGEAYIPYSNSEDHLGHLLPDFNGAVFKLHGDLRSSTGLILSTSDYRGIAEAENWNYWRTKMTSVFQMNRVVVIGHSLTDKNILHVLEAAKQGAGVHQPICWIAPNATDKQRQEYLERFRIRVVPYDNRDGDHRNLRHLIANISEFVPPRTKIHIQQQIAQLSQSPLGDNAAAPSFFVFNKLASTNDYEEKRLDVVIAAIQSTLPSLASAPPFTIETALEMAGWPSDFTLAIDFKEQIRSRAIEQQLIEPVGDQYKVGISAITTAAANRERFEHMRERFKESLKLRLRRKFPGLQDEEAGTISRDIESSLTGYFKEGGLSLATTLFSSGQGRRQSTVPSSIIKFISEASARYDDLLWRQAFHIVSVDAFVEAESAERDYLGRISQGFFAFHLLGAFGDVAIERLKQAQRTVWLIDSSAQIPAIALGAATNLAFIDCFSRLHKAGVRLFTTEKLFRETFEHYWFANKVIRDHGTDAPEVVQPPKENRRIENQISFSKDS